jgi:hypothetical protein
MSDREWTELLELFVTGVRPASTRQAIVRVICSWCRAVIVDGTIEPTSHGICAECSRRVESGDRRQSPRFHLGER